MAQLQRLLEASDAAIGVASEGYLPFLQEASEGLAMRMVDAPEAFHALPADEQALQKPSPTIFPTSSTPQAARASPAA